MKTYSFKDLSGAFAHPLAGSFVFAGQIGLGKIDVIMSTEKGALDTSADGTVMASFIAGDSGQLVIEVQQTSDLHKFLLAWYNLIKTASVSGDVSNWASAAITMRNIVDGSGHVAQGVMPLKVPDKSYAAQGGKIPWVLLAGDIQSQ